MCTKTSIYGRFILRQTAGGPGEECISEGKGQNQLELNGGGPGGGEDKVSDDVPAAGFIQTPTILLPRRQPEQWQAPFALEFALQSSRQPRSLLHISQRSNPCIT